MRSAQVSKNDKAKLAIYKGLIRRNDLEEIKKALRLYPSSFTEEDLLVIIEEAGLKGAETVLSEVLSFLKVLYYIVHKKKCLTAKRLL